MAVRIDKTVSQNESVANNYATLKTYLLRRAGRKLNDVEYIGLLRNNALGDLDDPGEALTNILEYITRIDDAGEISIYGKYKPQDFEITRKFVDNEITSSFLMPLKDVSLAGGVAGAVVATNPRIRIQDRTNLIDSFTGKGSINNVHKGPTAIFYKTKSGKLQPVGAFTFTSDFNLTTGAVNTGYTASWGSDFPSGYFGSSKQAFLITGYTSVATGKEISLVGTNIFLEADFSASPATFKAGSDASLERLKELRAILGTTAFTSTAFSLEREYSALTKPRWFTQSPGHEAQFGITTPTPGGPDDFNPETSDSVIFFDKGRFKLYSEPEYYNSGAYAPNRVPAEDQNSYFGDNVTKDSNMRFLQPPRVLRDNIYNWGARWDGYLRIDKAATARKYIFEVETNSAVKIDIYNGGVTSEEIITASAWETVIDTSYGSIQTNAIPTTNVLSSNFAQEKDRFVSRYSFTLDELDTAGTFSYDTSATTKYRYVPISIRMWNGGSDQVDPEQELYEVPLEPDLFLKYAHSETNAGDVDSFYSGDVKIAIASNNTDVTISDASDTPLIDDYLAAVNAGTLNVAANLQLVKIETTESITYIDENGDSQTIDVTTESAITPINITFSGSDSTNVDIATATDADGVDVKSTLTSGTAITYILRFSPNRSGYSYTTLWSTKIIGPKQEFYQGYADLLGGKSYTESVPNYIEPLSNKLTLDQRPEWWKVSDGNRYIRSIALSKSNDPLDGFKRNDFQNTLKSAEGPNNAYLGLYGDGAAAPNRVFSTRKNLILGEAKYPSAADSSNYLGLRLTSNFLGEGGKIKFTGIPINNADFDWTGRTLTEDRALGQNDLGGGQNHKTAINAQLTARTATIYWDGTEAGADITGKEKFLLHDNLGASTGPTIAQDDPNTYGLPAFGAADNAIWSQPITIVAVSDDTTNGPNSDGQFVAPLVLGVERVIYDRDETPGSRISENSATALAGNQVYLLAFTTAYVPSRAALDTKTITYYNDADVAFQYSSVDTGESISFADVLKATYDSAIIDSNTNPNGFDSSTSEIPKVASERVTPFGFDSPLYTQDICYPPYATSSPPLVPTVIDDATLYATGGSAKPSGNFDVFWGNHDTTGDGLTGSNFPSGKNMVLNVTEKLEFAYPDIGVVGESPADIVETITGIQLNFNNYSHRLKVELPIFDVLNPNTALDEDIYVHIGDQSKVKDVYYLFVNGRNDVADSTSGNLPELQG
jgi:hypothetical protein